MSKFWNAVLNSSAFGIFNRIKNLWSGISNLGNKATSYFDRFTENFDQYADSYLNSVTGAHLTGQQIEANQMQMQNLSDQYQYEVQGMQNAGLNPALMYKSGASTAPSVQGSPGSGSFADLLQLAMLPLNMKMLKAQISNVKSSTEKNLADTERTGAETERIRALTPHEVDDIVSKIDLRESEISLNAVKEDVELANAAILGSDAKVRDQFNAVNLRLAEANAAKSEVEKNKILEETKLLQRDFVLTFAQEAALKAEAGYYSQQTLNALVQNDILQFNTKTAKYEAKLTEYQYNHADGDRVWNRIATGAGALRDAGVGVGAVVGGFSKLGSSAPVPTISNTSTDVFGSDGSIIRSIRTRSSKNK